MLPTADKLGIKYDETIKMFWLIGVQAKRLAKN